MSEHKASPHAVRIPRRFSFRSALTTSIIYSTPLTPVAPASLVPLDPAAPGRLLRSSYLTGGCRILSLTLSKRSTCCASLRLGTRRVLAGTLSSRHFVYMLVAPWSASQPRRAMSLASHSRTPSTSTTTTRTSPSHHPFLLTSPNLSTKRVGACLLGRSRCCGRSRGVCC